MMTHHDVSVHKMGDEFLDWPLSKFRNQMFQLPHRTLIGLLNHATIKIL